MRRLPDKLYCPRCAARLTVGKMELSARCRKCKAKYWLLMGDSGTIMLTEKSAAYTQWVKKRTQGGGSD